MFRLPWSKKDPSIKDVDECSEEIRRLAATVHAERARVAAAKAFQKRGPTLPQTSIGVIISALENIRPLERDGEEAYAMLVQAAARQSPEVTLASLPPWDSVRIAAETTAAVDVAARVADVKAQEAERQLHKVMSTLSAPSYETVLRMELLPKYEYPICHVPFLDLSSAAAKECLAIALDNPSLSWLDLTGCCIDDAFIEMVLLDALRGHQHLGALSLGQNHLSRRIAALFAARLEEPSFAPSLRRLFIANGNDGDDTALVHISGLLADRRRRAILQDNIPLVISTTPKRKYRALVLDGCGMRAVAQLEWLMRLERKLDSGKHVGEEFDMIVATSWGTVIACALALRRPLSQVAEFFRLVSETAFCEGLRVGDQAYSYTVAAARTARSWWSSGGWYPEAPLLAALEKLFGDARFDFPASQVIAVLREIKHAAVNGPGEIRLAAAWDLQSVPLRRIDVINRTPGQATSVREVVAAAISTPSMFAPRHIRTATEISKAAQASMLSSVFGGTTEPYFTDALGLLPNPISIALAELHGSCHEALNRDTVVLSLGGAPPPVPGGRSDSSSAILASSLRCFSSQSDTGYTKDSLVTPHVAVAAAASAPSLVEEPSFVVDRIEPLAPGTVVARLDEPDATLLDAVRASCVFDFPSHW